MMKGILAWAGVPAPIPEGPKTLNSVAFVNTYSTIIQMIELKLDFSLFFFLEIYEAEQSGYYSFSEWNKNLNQWFLQDKWEQFTYEQRLQFYCRSLIHVLMGKCIMWCLVWRTKH